MPELQFIKFSVADRVATISFNSPASLNAFNQKMRLELIGLIDEIEQDNEVRVVVLTGEGRAFGAGADLTEGMPDYGSFVDQCAAEYEPWLMGIHNSSKLYIAAVNGAAAGIATAAVMNCDLVVMAEDAYLYQAFAAIGLIPDGGANWLLLQKLGYHRAIDMAVNAGKLTAQECLKLGLANRVVPAEQLLEKTLDWAQQIAEGAPLAQAAVKQVMRKASSMSYNEVINAEAVVQSELLNSEDAQNAVKAFFAKEKAVFKGR